ncbi:sigma-70 family RNA polymerase sigma factor [Stenotrophomonas maltophilia]|jgi:RNA polymerase sigma-70 factor (ECF subfamily)|nr:sigma-70 family RNA polymerase sigma factor [Stenotrophomonas maltophilia]
MSVPATSSSALAGFYREHHGWLLGWLRRRTHNAECAADLTQDTFVRLLSRQVDPAELRLPRAYLATIAHALLVNHWQRADLERAYLAALAAQPEPVHPSAEEHTQALQLLHAIADMLQGLAERPRRAFLMARLSGMGYAQIGQHLGVSERMVKKYMAQAMLHCLQLSGDLPA